MAKAKGKTKNGINKSQHSMNPGMDSMILMTI